jgi:hypothetical protein
MFKKASKSVCTSTIVVSSDPMSPSIAQTPKNTEEDPDDPKPADEGDIQLEYSSISCTADM